MNIECFYKNVTILIITMKPMPIKAQKKKENKHKTICTVVLDLCNELCLQVQNSIKLQNACLIYSTFFLFLLQYILALCSSLNEYFDHQSR